MVVYYFAYGRSHGFSASATGLCLPLKKLWRTIVLAILVIVCSYGIVFFADYFFQTDFRIWVFGIKVFGSDKVLIALRYLPFFLAFYVINSISVNCFNYNTIGGEVGNTLLEALANSFACMVIVAVQYGYFYAKVSAFCPSGCLLLFPSFSVRRLFPVSCIRRPGIPTWQALSTRCSLLCLPVPIPLPH